MATGLRLERHSASAMETSAGVQMAGRR